MSSCFYPGELLEGESSKANRRGTVQVLLTDLPLDVQEVWITILSVEIHSALAGWQTVVDSTPDGVEFNLLTLIDKPAEVGIKELAPDVYTQIRLILSAANWITVDGVTYPLIIPSGEQTGVKLTGDFELAAGGTVKILLDFDAEKSVHMAKDGKYQLKPTITIKEVTKEPGEG
jgi:hypothetical protein